jgi:cysteine desulfurase/selenocysteine lyase
LEATVRPTLAFYNTAGEVEALVKALWELTKINGLKLIGTAENKASVLSFVLDGFTNDQVGKYLNTKGIAVRTGHHCAQPVLRFFGLESTVRPTLAFYNTASEVEALVKAIRELVNG